MLAVLEAEDLETEVRRGLTAACPFTEVNEIAPAKTLDQGCCFGSRPVAKEIRSYYFLKAVLYGTIW